MSNIPTIKVEFAFGYTPNDASPVWTEVVATDYSALAFTCKRGRAFELDNFQPGTATITLDNRDGRYTPPGNTPYADQMLLMVPVRIRATQDSTTYDVWRGYVERIPVTWQQGGMYGTVDVSAVDLISLLGLMQQDTGVLGDAILSDTPVGFWPLDDPQGSTTARQVADSSAQLATIRRPTSAYTAPTFGSEMTGLAGFGSSPVGVKFNGGGTTYQQGGGLIADLGGTFNGHFALEMWVLTPNVTLGTGQQFALAQFYDRTSPSTDPPGLLVRRAGLGGLLGVSWGGSTAAANYTGTFLDGKLHHVVVDVGSTFTYLYVDGAVVSIAEDSTASYDTNLIAIGCSYTSTGAQDFFPGTIAAVALYDHGLGQDVVTDHYNAGLTAFAGELTGARISRILDYSGYPVTTAIDDGATRMEAASLSGQSMAQSIQDATSTERGRFFIAGDGTATFLERAAEYNLTASITFGDDTDADELPYADLTYSYDPDYLFNDITVTCTAGSARVVDTDSITKYGRRATTITIQAQNGNEARALAQYLLVRFREPSLRVASVTINPDRTAGLWAAALGTEIGDVVAHNRRPDGAPDILDMTYVVESIQHTVNAKAGTWQTVFELSPLLSGVHFWTLEDATYGQIDNPGILISA